MVFDRTECRANLILEVNGHEKTVMDYTHASVDDVELSYECLLDDVFPSLLQSVSIKVIIHGVSDLYIYIIG